MNQRSLFATGDLWPMDIPVSQSWADMGASMMAIQEFGIQTFIEIGIDRGGFAAMLAARTQFTTLTYRGIEIRRESIDDRAYSFVQESPRASIIVQDFFSDGGQAWLIDGLLLPGPALVFCDGGDKPREVAIVAPLLRPGDYVMIHDFTVWCQPEDVPGYLERLTPPWLDRTLIGLYRRPQ